MLKKLRANKNEIVSTAGIDVYRLFIAAVIAFYVVIFAAFVICFAVDSHAAETGRKSDKSIIKEYIRGTYGKQYKTRIAAAENTPDRVLENRAGKRVVYVDKFETVSRGKYGIVEKRGPFAGRKMDYIRKHKRGKKIYIYLIYSPYSNSTEDVIAVLEAGKLTVY